MQCIESSVLACGSHARCPCLALAHRGAPSPAQGHLLDLAPEGLPGHLGTALCCPQLPPCTRSLPALTPAQPLELLVQAAAEPAGCQAEPWLTPCAIPNWALTPSAIPAEPWHPLQSQTEPWLMPSAIPNIPSTWVGCWGLHPFAPGFSKNFSRPFIVHSIYFRWATGVRDVGVAKGIKLLKCPF